MIENIKRFALKEEHINLLTNSNVYWNESYYGAAGIYPKKPYGNSNVSKSLADIMGEVFDENNTEQHKRMLKLHEETEIALQIILDSKSFEPGVYEKIDYDKWKRTT